jgi:hypothetical protein
MIQGYFSSLIQQQRSEENRRVLLELIDKYKSVPGERAREMEASARAFMASFYDNDQARAFDIIDDAISSFPTNKYPLLTKMDIAVRAGNKVALKGCLDKFRDEAHRGSSFYNAYKRSEAIYLALTGDFRKGMQIVEREMPNYSDTARTRLLERLVAISLK